MSKWIAFAAVLFSLKANAQISKITGTSENWIGKQVRLMAQSDPITKSFIYLDEDTIATDGSFSLEVTSSKTGMYFLAINRFRSPIWIAPNKEYHITLLPDTDNIPVDTWKYGNIEYAFSTPDSSDVNYQISEFNSAFYNFYLDHAQHIGSHRLKTEVEKFEKSQNINFSSNEYIDVYKVYSIAAMKLSSGYKKNELFDNYLKNKPIVINNNAYFNFFNLFFSDYFQSFDSRFGGATISNRLKMGMDADSLFSFLKQDSFLENDSLMQLVLLHSISEVYTQRAYPEKTLVEILDTIAAQPLTPQALEISNKLKEKIKNPLLGSSISKYDYFWDRNHWVTHSDTLPTVIMVSFDGSAKIQKEKIILQTLAEKYPDVAHFAEIRIGAHSQVQDEAWPVYYPNNEFSFLEEFGVYNFPHMIWINGNEEILHNGIEKPSDGLESRLYKLQSIYNSRKQIKVGHH